MAVAVAHRHLHQSRDLGFGEVFAGSQLWTVTSKRKLARAEPVHSRPSINDASDEPLREQIEGLRNAPIPPGVCIEKPGRSVCDHHL